MKKIVILFLLMSSFLRAQDVTIPDVNFKALLTSQSITTAFDNNFNQVIIDTNLDGEIQSSEALMIYRLSVSNSNINDLTGIEAFTNLTYLNCQVNNLTTLNVSSNTNLTQLDCSFNQLTSLDVTMLVNLTVLICDENQLTTLDLQNSSNLNQLECLNNLFTTIDLSNLVNLTILHIGNSNLNTVDFSSLVNLQDIAFGSGLQANLDFTNSPNISSFFLINNSVIQNLDLSYLPNLNLITIDNNSQLEYLNLKTGSLINNPSSIISNNPNLKYVCVDEQNYDLILLNSSLNNVDFHINSYCSFVPGGNYNTINGSITFDQNNDGCDITDLAKPNIKLVMNGDATFTENNGNYNFYTSAGSFDIAPSIENESVFSVSPPTANVIFNDNSNNTFNQNFCVSAIGIFPDVEAVVGPFNSAVANSVVKYILVYKNKGNQTVSGTLNLNFNENQLGYISASQVPDVTNLNSLSWNISNLLPFENRSIEIEFQVNPSLATGDDVNVSTSFNTIELDQLPQDNAISFKQSVVDVLQSSSITCIEGNSVPNASIGQYLHYAINFDNTGSRTINNAVIRMDFNTETNYFDISSFQILNASHNMYIRQTGNRVEIILPNCGIESGGHGTVMLKIKSNPTILANEMISTLASIYFDYERPIETNTAETTFILDTPSFIKDNSITILPNPTKNNININCNNIIKTVELYDIQGRLLEVKFLDMDKTILDISEKTNGIYFVKVTSEKGIKIEKILKE